MTELPVIGLVALGWNPAEALEQPLNNIKVAARVLAEEEDEHGRPLVKVGSLMLIPGQSADAPLIQTIKEWILDEYASDLTVSAPGHWRFENPREETCFELISVSPNLSSIIIRLCGVSGPENRFTPAVPMRLADSVVAGDDLESAEMIRGCLGAKYSQEVRCIWGDSIFTVNRQHQNLNITMRTHPDTVQRKRYLKKKYKGHKRKRTDKGLVIRVSRHHEARRVTQWLDTPRRIELWERSDVCLVLRDVYGTAVEQAGYCHDVTDFPAAQKSRSR